VSFAVWLTGFSGSGKSAVARELGLLLARRGIDYSVLESDVLRTQLTPATRYDAAERDFFYGVLAELGVSLVRRGRPVLFDATANLRRYRDMARRDIRQFAEVHVDTPLEVCRARDPKGLYRKGRTATLPGVQAAYEAPLAPELRLSGAEGSPAAAAAAIGAWLENRGWLARP
jgi:adenylylsulfate kinase-like enzyme